MSEAARLPEIPESEATGEVATIYADLRASYGVSVVNYIWRCLAAVGGLGWAWAVVKPARGAIAAAAPQLRAMARQSLEEAGLLGGAVIVAPPVVGDIVRAYSRGNSWNLLSVSLLRCARGGAAATLPAAAGGDEAALPAVPPYPDFTALPVSEQAAIARLAGAGPAASSGVRPSLWVHLAPYPLVLAAMAEAMPTVLGSAEFAACHRRLLSQAHALLGLGQAAPVAAGDETGHVLAAFHGRIAEMVLAGQVLEARLG